MLRWHVPANADFFDHNATIRVDSGVSEGDTVGTNYGEDVDNTHTFAHYSACPGSDLVSACDRVNTLALLYSPAHITKRNLFAVLMLCLGGVVLQCINLCPVCTSGIVTSTVSLHAMLSCAVPPMLCCAVQTP